MMIFFCSFIPQSFACGSTPCVFMRVCVSSARMRLFRTRKRARSLCKPALLKFSQFLVDEHSMTNSNHNITRSLLQYQFHKPAKELGMWNHLFSSLSLHLHQSLSIFASSPCTCGKHLSIPQNCKGTWYVCHLFLFLSLLLPLYRFILFIK